MLCCVCLFVYRITRKASSSADGLASTLNLHYHHHTTIIIITNIHTTIQFPKILSHL